MVDVEPDDEHVPRIPDHLLQARAVAAHHLATAQALTSAPGNEATGVVWRTNASVASTIRVIEGGHPELGG